jgi:hypothetical protein
MDNNKDRKFYWEVKDFMTKKHEPKTSAPSSSLKDSIKNVLEQNNSYVQKTFDRHSEAVNVGSKFIAQNVDAQKGYNTNCVAYTKNKNVNDFSVGKMITEQQATSFGQSNRGGGSVGGPGGAGVMGGGGGGGGGSWRERNPEAYARNVAAQQELEARRAQNLAASRRRRAEDEAADYNTTQPQGPTPTGGNIGSELEMDPNDPTMPLDTPANRAKLRDFRQNKQADKVASRLQELSGKDPSSLTASETAEISLLKSMTQGSVATAGLEGKVKERLGAAYYGGQAIKGPNEVILKTLGRSQADLVAQTQTKVKSEAEAKAAEQKAYEQQLAAERYAKMQDQIIQGTNMTYGQFKAQYNRDYDARNPEDSAMLVRAASNRSAFRVSPTARSLDQTTVDFNRSYRDINAANAARQGQLDRRVDAAQRDLDQFNADRRGTVQREIQAIQTPEFIQGVAQDMARAAGGQMRRTNMIPPPPLQRPTASRASSASQTAPKTYRI